MFTYTYYLVYYIFDNRNIIRIEIPIRKCVQTMIGISNSLELFQESLVLVIFPPIKHIKLTKTKIISYMIV